MPILVDGVGVRLEFRMHNSSGTVGLDPVSLYTPVCVAGDLCYGGKLHYVVAGTVYAGSVPARIVMGEFEGHLLPLKYGVGEYQFVEIYYVESWRLKEIIRHLSQMLGVAVKSQTLRLKEGRCIVYCEALVAGGETHDVRVRGNQQRKWARILLAMPPHATIVAPPLAVYPLAIDNIEPCPDGRAYCEVSGSSFVVGVHDVYVNMDRLREAFPRDIKLKILPAKDPLNRLYCVYTPIRHGNYGECKEC